MKNVLIMGGGGFIGMNIARRLADAPDRYSLTLADRSFRRRIDEYFPDSAERVRPRIIEDDFSGPEAYAQLSAQYDEVYMMAAIVGVNRTLAEPEEVIRVNTALTHYTLDWLRRSKVGKLVFASSSENYAGTTDAFDYPVPTSEDVPLCIQDISHPRFTYAVTKIHGESAFLHSARALGYDCSIVRYQNVFGPCMGFRHVIPHLVQRFYKGEMPFTIYGPDQTRAFCHISDAVDGTIRMMESERANGEVYHIGNPEEITMETLTRAVGALMGYKGDYINGPSYPGSVQRRCPDITKVREHLGYEPRTGWQEGLETTVAWYRKFFESNRPLDDAGFEPPENFAA